MIIKLILIISIIFYVASSIDIIYPNCAKNIVISPNNVTDTAALKFIQLTQFFNTLNIDTLTNASINFIFHGDQESFNKIMISEWMLTAILGCICVLILISLIIGWFQWKIQHYLKIEQIQYKNKSSTFIIIIGSLILLTLIIGTIIFIPQMWSTLKQSLCRVTLFLDMLKQGDNGYNWHGVNFHMQKTNQTINLLSRIQQFNQKLLQQYNSKQIKDRMIQISNNYRSIIEQYNNNKELFLKFIIDQNISISIQFNKLFPQIFNTSQNNSGLIFNLQNSMQTISRYVQTSVSLEQNITQLHNSINSTIPLLQNSLIEQLQQSNQILNWNNAINNKFDFLQNIIQLFGRILDWNVGFCCIFVSILLVCVIALKYQYTVTIWRAYNISWLGLVLSAVFFYMSIIYLRQIMVINEGSCLVYNNILHNQTFFNKNGRMLQTSYSKLFKTLKECIYKSGNYEQLFRTEQHFKKLEKVINSYQNYRTYTIQKNNNKSLLIEYHHQIQQINTILQYYKYSANQKSVYSFIKQNYPTHKLLIDYLNSYTLSNLFGQNCYYQHWVIDYLDCIPGQPIYIKLQYQVYKNHKKNKLVSCITFNQYNQSFYPIKSITYIQFLKLYINTRQYCPLTYTKIISLGQKIINQLQDKYIIIDSLIQKLKELDQQITLLNRYIRTYYAEKMYQYQQFYKQFIKDNNIIFSQFIKINNCSTIKYHLIQGYNVYCIQFRASLRKLLFCLFSSIIVCTILIGLGFQYGIQLKKKTQIIVYSAQHNQKKQELEIKQTKSEKIE